jgi:vacuolar-type H+-ATPase subunit B/Vma2
MLNKNEKQDLKTLIEEEEQYLRFFAQYEKEFIESESEKEWEMAVNNCLDVLIPLYNQLNNH